MIGRNHPGNTLDEDDYGQASDSTIKLDGNFISMEAVRRVGRAATGWEITFEPCSEILTKHLSQHSMTNIFSAASSKFKAVKMQ